MSNPGVAPTRLTHARWAEWTVADDWEALTERFFSSDEGKALLDRLCNRLQAGAVVYPPEPLRALQLTHW